MSSKNQNKKNSYFLRTQSTLLKGEKTIPFYSTRSKSKNKFLSSSKSKTDKKIYGNFSSRNKSAKTKKYINSKINNKKIPGVIDLNKISGSSHSFSNLNQKINKNIIPNESNRISNFDKKENPDEGNKSKNSNYEIYLTNKTSSKKNENSKNNEYSQLNKNIYNSKLYTPFYDLIDNISKKNNNDNINKINENNNNIRNNNFFNSNHIVEINNNPINEIKDKSANNNLKNKRKNSANKKIKEDKLNLKNKNDILNNNKIKNKTMEIQVNDLLDSPNEEYRESIMSKTIKCLNDIKNNYNYNYSINDHNTLRNFYNKENYNSPNYFNDEYQIKTYKIFNKYPNNKNITYHYHESKNNNNIDIKQYKSKYTDPKNINNTEIKKYKNNNYINKNKISLMLNKLNCSLNSTKNINKENYESNSNPQINIKINNINNLSNLSENRKLRPYESFLGGKEKKSIISNDSSKYFLKSLLEQNLTNKYINDFNYYSPLKQNKKYISFSDFDFNFQSSKIEKDLAQSPRSFFNLNKDEDKLKKMLKQIPTHKNENPIHIFTDTVLNMLNNNNFKNKDSATFRLIPNKKNKLSIEEINSVMPPNILEKKE